MIALQTPQGLRFGHILRVEPPELIFEADARITEGEEFAWRMELTGYKETVLGRLQVRHIQRRGGGEVPVFHCRILEVDEDDQDLFDGWLADIAAGGISRRFERDPSSFVHSEFGHAMRGASKSETSMALDRIQSRRAFRRKLKANQPGDSTSDPLGLHSEVASKSVDTAYGREAMRKALRKSTLDRQRDGAPHEAPPSPTPASPPRQKPVARATKRSPDSASKGPAWLDRLDSTSTHSKGPAWLDRLDSTSTHSRQPDRSASPQAPSAAARPANPAPRRPEPPAPKAPTEPSTPEPQISFDPHAVPPHVYVRFRTVAAFAREHRRHIAALGLFVPFQIAAGTQIQVSFTLPSGQQVHTTAMVVAPMTTGSGLALDLSASHQKIFATLAAQAPG